MRAPRTTVAFARKFVAQGKALVLSLGATLTYESTMKFEKRGGQSEEIPFYEFKIATARYGVISGTVYHDWVHLRVDNLELFKVEQSKHMCPYWGADMSKVSYPSGKWNVHHFSHGYHVESTLAEVKKRIEILKQGEPIALAA